MAKRNFPVKIAVAGVSAELLFEELRGKEQLSEPYTYELTALSDTGDISPEETLGRQATVTVDQPERGPQRFGGLVSRFVRLGQHKFAEQTLYRYQLRLQPWFWFLTRAADCRVFQQKSVKEIFAAVVNGRGFSSGEHYELDLQGTPPKREYCVQYRETDFNFLSRLLEDAGIWYFFRHEEDRQIMVLTDAASGHKPVTKYEQIVYHQTAGEIVTEDRIENWWVEHSVQTGKYTSTDYNFAKPDLSYLAPSRVKPSSRAGAAFEVYEYPALPEGLPESDSMQVGDMQKVVDRRLEELGARAQLFHGDGSCIGVRAGARFDLQEHPDERYNCAYVVVAAEQTLASNQYMAGEQDAEFRTGVILEAIKADSVYRPPRTTPKPIIHGAQTAVVVGPSGQEIYTDKHARIKVQFHWDRQGKKDDKSSCWVRVMQAWAGAGWGAIFTPRVGQEVVVSFLEGDPDRPLVTGGVYNGTQVPPYALPDNKTRSTVKTNSSQGGGGSNEIRFEDKKGSEEVFVHAQKDMNTLVENDSTTQIKHDRTLKIEHDETCTVKNDRSATVEHDETCTVKNDHSTSIQGNEKRDVSNKRTTTVGDNDSLTISKSGTVDITEKYTLTAGEQITLKTGASSLVMKADGTIQLEGVSIKINGKQQISQSAGLKIEVSATQFKLGGTLVQMQGSLFQISSTLLQLKASGVGLLQGGLISIG